MSLRNGRRQRIMAFWNKWFRSDDENDNENQQEDDDEVPNVEVIDEEEPREDR